MVKNLLNLHKVGLNGCVCATRVGVRGSVMDEVKKLIGKGKNNSTV